MPRNPSGNPRESVGLSPETRENDYSILGEIMHEIRVSLKNVKEVNDQNIPPECIKGRLVYDKVQMSWIPMQEKDEKPLTGNETINELVSEADSFAREFYYGDPLRKHFESFLELPEQVDEWKLPSLNGLSATQISQLIQRMRRYLEIAKVLQEKANQAIDVSGRRMEVLEKMIKKKQEEIESLEKEIEKRWFKKASQKIIAELRQEKKRLEKSHSDIKITKENAERALRYNSISVSSARENIKRAVKRNLFVQIEKISMKFEDLFRSITNPEPENYNSGLKAAYIEKIGPMIREAIRKSNKPMKDHPLEKFYYNLGKKEVLENFELALREDTEIEAEHPLFQLIQNIKILNDLREKIITLDNKAIFRVMAKMAAFEIEKIKNELIVGFDDRERADFYFHFTQKFNLGSLFGQEYQGPGFQGNEYFSGQCTYDMKYPEPLVGEESKVWHEMRNFPEAGNVFGGIMEEFDKVNEERLFEKVIAGPQHEAYLAEVTSHPTPTRLCLLILLSVAPSSNEEKRKKIHLAMKELKKGDDLKKILDETEKKYPEFEPLSKLIENENEEETLKPLDWKDSAIPLARTISQSKEGDDKPLKVFALTCLPNHELLNLLLKKKTINPDEMIEMEKAERVVEKMKTQLEKNQTKDSPKIDESFPHRFRERLINCNTYIDDEKEFKRGVETLNQMNIWSRAVLIYQQDEEKIHYLSSEEVFNDAGYVKGPKASEALLLVENGDLILKPKMKEIRRFLMNESETLMKTRSDVEFLNQLVGEFGQRADSLIRGYHECLKAGAITSEDRPLLLEFVRQFRVISPAIIAGYKAAKEAKVEQAYIASLRATAEKMTGSTVVTDKEKTEPYYADLIKHVYPNNAGDYTNYKANESCSDRSDDLKDLKIKPRYEMDLLSQSEIRVKEGKTANPEVLADMQRPIYDIAKNLEVLPADSEKSAVNEQIDRAVAIVFDQGGIEELSAKDLKKPTEKLLIILLDQIYGRKSISPEEVKKLLLTFEFSYFEDVSEYIAGTRDRVAQASNQEYALLCELSTLYADRIKEINRGLVQLGWENPAIAEIMPRYFQKEREKAAKKETEQSKNRLQLEKLGMSEGFIKQIQRTLEKRKKKKYSLEIVRKIVQRYEKIISASGEKHSSSKNTHTKAVYGQLKAQREKTMEAVKVLQKNEVDPKNFHLGEVNLAEMIEAETKLAEGAYDPEQFATYTAQRMIDLFQDERSQIHEELDKYESISGKDREVLFGYISKTKETANARMVGGVCVSGDNPEKNPRRNLWDNPGYLQLVLQDPENLSCKGLVLLHHFTENGKKILTASYNPSSTYLYSVDEAALFKALSTTLEQFATENGFDMIVVSKNKAIRTNRTGGQFEKAINEKIAQVGKEFRFEKPVIFSYSPGYSMDEMDVVWEKK
jgi:hypothetical protein